jgi:peroxiredoxin Q/BCP
MAIEINQKAPNFNALDDFGNHFDLSEYQGKWIVLYFYPKDNTSGCTKEACSFKDNMEQITQYGAEVIGVSPDSVKSHANFKNKYELNFRLIADTDKEICKLYDVLGEKSMYGKKYIGVVRTTFIIDPEGIIRWVKSNVKVDGHIEEVINTLKDLRSK